MAKKVLAMFQFAKTLQKLPESIRHTIRSPQDAAICLMDLQYEAQEHFVVLFLNVKNQVIGRKTIFIGSLNSAVAHPREVMKEAIKHSAASIILAHCHRGRDMFLFY